METNGEATDRKTKNHFMFCWPCIPV